MSGASPGGFTSVAGIELLIVEGEEELHDRWGPDVGCGLSRLVPDMWTRKKTLWRRRVLLCRLCKGLEGILFHERTAGLGRLVEEAVVEEWRVHSLATVEMGSVFCKTKLHRLLGIPEPCCANCRINQ